MRLRRALIMTVLAFGIAASAHAEEVDGETAKRLSGAQDSLDLQRYDEAIVALKKNTELQPMSPYGWYQLARVRFDRQEPEETRKIIRHLKGFEPKVAAQLERETGLVA